jgi:cell division protein FtsL
MSGPASGVRRAPTRAASRGRAGAAEVAPGPLAAPLRAVLAGADAAASSPLVDRLLRGRAWVVGIGVLLAGIVFFNVALLELNGGLARTEARVAKLKRANAELRLRVGDLASSERIQEAAAMQGFVLPAPRDVTYLRPRPGEDGRRAVAALGRGDASLTGAAPSTVTQDGSGTHVPSGTPLAAGGVEQTAPTTPSSPSGAPAP